MDADVAVIGAGPAGSTVANRLARLGFRIRIFEASAFPRPHIGESFPASVLPLFEELRVREEIEEAGFLRPRGAIVHWAGVTRHRADAANGFQVDRGRFDGILLRAALRQGADLSQPARVKHFHRIREQEWCLTVEERDSELKGTYRFVVDATGRKGFLPGRKRLPLQPPTLAMYAYWEDVPLADPETLIEATGDQWYWAALLPDGTANATVFVEAKRVNNRTPIEIEKLYLELLRTSQLLSCFLGGRMLDSVQACSAGATRVENPVGDDWLKIGEAAISYDPLSSQGVQNAIVSGLQGAAIVNTLLGYPEARNAAMTFCRDRLDENASQHTQTLARYYRQQAAVIPSDFWKSRANAHEPIEIPHRSEPTELTLGTWVRLNPHASWLPTPVLSNDRIAMRNGLHLHSYRPLVWLDGIPVEYLLRWPLVHKLAVELLAAWTAVIGQARSNRILIWLIEREFLVRTNSDSTDDQFSTKPSLTVCRMLGWSSILTKGR